MSYDVYSNRLDTISIQKQPSRGGLKKRCSENINKFTGEHPRQNVKSHLGMGVLL